MNRNKKLVVFGLCLLLILGVLRIVAASMPLNMGIEEWETMVKCAEYQKNLYLHIHSHVEANKHIPGDRDGKVRDWASGANGNWKCPLAEGRYKVHPENYGNPKAVFISDEENNHPTKIMWWFRGLHPRIQTMGDGTIQFFKDGKMMTMNSVEKKK